MNTILTAYFSRRGNNYYGGTVKYLEVGNTEIVARRIHERVGGTLLHIETVQPYAEDYRQCIEEAKRELRANVRPQLVTAYRGAENIDLLLLGYPNWCGTMPMAVWTFLESRDFTGTRIAPFCTHEGGGMGRSGRDLAALCPHSEVLPGLVLRGSEVDQADGHIAAWLASLAISAR